MIIADAYIPFFDGVAEQLGTEIRTLAPDQITPAAVRDARALLVRTRTRCDADLLAGSNVRFVGTATIGLDHIDRQWCADNGITAVNAPGCNAPAVAQYVMACIMTLGRKKLSDTTLGIVGVGNVGRIVERWARGLGMRVLMCDPPRAMAEGGSQWLSLNDLAAQSDVVTFHTPLTRTGKNATYHLADDAFFDALKPGATVINAARGPVADTAAWLRALADGRCGAAVVDTWEGEPAISHELMDAAAIATPHIAGYSRQGKIRATAMVVDAMCRTLGMPCPTLPVAVPGPVPETVTADIIAASYSPLDDDRLLRDNPRLFESLRDGYALRNEPGY